METAHVPDFLTVAEAARVLRIGRTAAYEQARFWLATGGHEGLPVQKVGGLLRVPRALFEQHYGIGSRPFHRTATGAVPPRPPRSSSRCRSKTSPGPQRLHGAAAKVMPNRAVCPSPADP